MVLQCIIAAWVIAALLPGSGSIKDINLDFSSVITMGEPVTMRCSFNMENETLYSIKIYKGNTEFLHFIPEFSPPYGFYSIRGVSVNRTRVVLDDLKYEYTSSTQGIIQSIPELKSLQVNKGEIVISQVATTLYSQGLYGCEVSADFPSFDTKIVRQRLHVLVEPASQPRIQGLSANYSSGQLLNVTCVAEDSYPASNITWFISGHKVSEARSEVMRKTTGLFTSISFLELTLNHTVSVKCISSLWTHHYQSKDLTISVVSNQTEHKIQAIKDKNTAGKISVKWITFCILYIAAGFT